MRFYKRSALLILGTVIVAGAWTAAHQSPCRVISLAGGTVRQAGTIEPNGYRCYRFPLSEGDFLQARIEQPEIDLKGALFEAESRSPVLEADCEEVVGSAETLVHVAQSSGDYRLRIEPAKESQQGRFVLTIQPARPADAAARSLAQAYAALSRAEAEALGARDRGGPQEQAIHLQGAIQGFTDVIDACSRLKDLSCEALALRRRAFAYGLLSQASTARPETIRWMSERIADTIDAADIYKTLGDHAQASIRLKLAAYDTLIHLNERRGALDLARQSLDAAGERHSSLEKAQALYLMGLVYKYGGAYQPALQRFWRSSEVLRSLRNSGLPSPDALDQQLQVQRQVAGIQTELGRFAEARRSLQAVVQGRRDGGNDRSLALGLINLGQLNNVESKTPEALDCFEEALGLLAEDPASQISAYQGIGIAHINAGDHLQALDAYQTALRLSQQLQYDDWVASIRIDLCDVHLEMGQLDRAEASCRESLRILEDGPHFSWRAAANHLLARTLKAQGDDQGAMGAFEESIRLIEQHSRRLLGPQMRRDFYHGERYRLYYQLYIEHLMSMHAASPEQGYDEKILMLLEAIRSRELRKHLAEAEIESLDSVDDEEFERILERRQEMEALLHQIEEAEKGGGGADLESLRMRLDELLLEDELARGGPADGTASATNIGRPPTLSLEQIQNELLDDDSLILAYSLGDDSSYLWVVGQDVFRSFELPRGRDWIAGKVDEFLSHLSRKPSNLVRDRPRQLAEELADALLEPAGEILDRRTLLILPDGPLQTLPFQALRPRGPGDSQRLEMIENHIVAVLPSASTLAQIRERAERIPQAPFSAAVIADPVYDGWDDRYAASGRVRPSVIFEGADLPRLRHSAKEAERIISFDPQGRSFQATGFEANLDALLSGTLSDYRLIHFATHAVPNKDRPELSRLVLSQFDEQGRAIEGDLRASHIYRMRLPADLVVLSACETGLGKVFRGEGLAGLAQAFIYAGASRVIATLWRVEDEAAQALMAGFYEELRRGVSPAEALRTTQLRMKSDPAWDLRSWAGFVLIGDPRMNGRRIF